MVQHVLLLTGVPGVGKTTVVQRVAKCLSRCRLAGFYTEEIREHGVRQGFRLTTLDGQKRIMAHVDFAKTYRVGRYGVDVSAIDAVAEDALRLALDTDLYLVDEVGKMECFSSGFITTMRRLLSSDRAVVATVAKRGAGFIDEVKHRSDMVLWEVTHANRDGLPEAVIVWLEEHGGLRKNTPMSR